MNWVTRAERCHPPTHQPPACHGDFLPAPLSCNLLLCLERAGPAPAQPLLLAAPPGATGLGGVNLLVAHVAIHAALLLLP